MAFGHLITPNTCRPRNRLSPGRSAANPGPGSRHLGGEAGCGCSQSDGETRLNILVWRTRARRAGDLAQEQARPRGSFLWTRFIFISGVAGAEIRWVAWVTAWGGAHFVRRLWHPSAAHFRLLLVAHRHTSEFNSSQILSHAHGPQLPALPTPKHHAHAEAHPPHPSSSPPLSPACDLPTTHAAPLLLGLPSPQASSPPEAPSRPISALRRPWSHLPVPEEPACHWILDAPSRLNTSFLFPGSDPTSQLSCSTTTRTSAAVMDS